MFFFPISHNYWSFLFNNVGVCVCMCVYVESIGHCRKSSSVVLYLSFGGRVSDWTWRSLMLWAWLASKGSAHFYLPSCRFILLHAAFFFFSTGNGDLNSGFRPAQQVSHWLSQPPTPGLNNAVLNPWYVYVSCTQWFEIHIVVKISRQS